MPSQHLCDDFAGALARHSQGIARLVVAFSGGLDSTVLLHLASRQSLPVTAIYCNHGRAFGTPTDEWDAHNKRICQLLGVGYHSYRIALSDGNAENAARQARYKVFANFCKASDLLLLAHHLDDQHETILAKLARGASLQGLLMPQTRLHGRARLLRPLLRHNKNTLLAYARQQQLQWVEDASNLAGDNTRARIRHRLMPALRSIWPGWSDGMRASQKALAHNAACLDYFSHKELLRLLDGKGLPLSSLGAYPYAVQEQLLLHWLRSCNLMLPGQGTLANHMHLLLAGKGNNTRLELRMANDQQAKAWLRLYQQRLWLHAQLPQPPTSYSNHWDGQQPLHLPGSTLVCHDPCKKRLQVTLSKARTQVRLHGRDHGSQLVKVMQSQGIPAWERALTPQIYNNQQLIALGDTPLCEEARMLKLAWQPGWRLQPHAYDDKR